MTREEFNKLSQQDRLNLVAEKWFGLYKNDKEYGWFIERSYTTDEDGNKHLSHERSWLDIQLPFEKYFDGLDIWLGKDRCGVPHICYKSEGLTFSIGTIPSGFLEESYFMEIPKSSINEIIDEYSLDVFTPFEQLYKDYRSVEEICKGKKKKEIPINETKSKVKWFDNPQTMTKVNITLICIAALITIINILVFL